MRRAVGSRARDVHGDGRSPATAAAVGAAGGALLGAAIGRALKTDTWLPMMVLRGNGWLLFPETMLGV
jgi:outer membrane lipoprotein SlyB